MPRLLIQSSVHGKFVYTDPAGDILLTQNLAAALASGICWDYEQADQIIQDHFNRTYMVVDLDAEYGE